jgi:hypothetical protein
VEVLVGLIYFLESNFSDGVMEETSH